MMIVVASVLAYPLDKQGSPENPNYGKVEITINKHNKYLKIMLIPELQSCPGLKEEERDIPSPHGSGCPSRPGPSLDRDKLGIRAWVMDLRSMQNMSKLSRPSHELGSQVLYAREGARSMMDWTFMDFLCQVRVDVNVFEIKVLENEDESYHNFDPQSMHDKMLKVVSISGTWHFGKLQVGVLKARRVAQGQLIKIQLLAIFHVQIDAAIDHVIEYVGSKNAIQIHSHAQKYFAKVARDSVNDGDESLNMIDIPSPRPKKNPLHPYPRKMVDSPVANKAVLVQPENSPSPNISGRESRSPDSILLEIGSGVSECPVSEQQNSHFSPASCTTDVHTAYIIFAENDDEIMTSKSITVEEIHV
ncbi:Diacylglycerol kinase 1 [Capsicum chinense]|nr:Diacylglycerol kinase 1 [Capsicum chinense]